MIATFKCWFNERIGSFSFWYRYLKHGTGAPNRYKFFGILHFLFKYAVFGINTVYLGASSVCQLKCPACPTGKGLTKKEEVGWGHLKFKDLKKFIDENPNIKHIGLAHWGEIFLNPELKGIIRYAYDKNVALSAGVGVNLNSVSEELIEDLVKYKFRKLVVSIDGASSETYKIYRVGGNFDKVIDNVRKINFYKNKYNSKYPKLGWQFIIFGHNEHELPKAKKMAEELNMNFLPKLNHTPSYSPIKNEDLARQYSEKGVISREEFEHKFKRDYLKPCAQLWISPFINWDGKLLGCCVNRDVDFGNVFEKGLKESLKSEKYEYAKNMILGKVKPREDIPCHNCKYYGYNKKFTKN